MSSCRTDWRSGAVCVCVCCYLTQNYQFEHIVGGGGFTLLRPLCSMFANWGLLCTSAQQVDNCVGQLFYSVIKFQCYKLISAALVMFCKLKKNCFALHCEDVLCREIYGLCKTHRGLLPKVKKPVHWKDINASCLLHPLRDIFAQFGHLCNVSQILNHRHFCTIKTAAHCENESARKNCCN